MLKPVTILEANSYMLKDSSRDSQCNTSVWRVLQNAGSDLPKFIEIIFTHNDGSNMTLNRRC